MSDDKRDEQGKFVAGNSGRPIGSKNLASYKYVIRFNYC